MISRNFIRNRILNVSSSGKHIVGNAGIAIVGNIFDKVNLGRFNNLSIELAHPANTYPLSDVVKAEVMSMCCGDPSFEGIRDFREDEDFYAGAAGMTVGIPSPETVRQRLDLCGISEDSFKEFHEAAVLCNRELLKGEELTCEHGYLMVDLDVTPFNESKSSKEGISMTYKHFIGYSPNYAQCGKEKGLLFSEWRPGKQHCQKGTPEFISQAIESAFDIYPSGDVMFRMDSGNDSMENYGILIENGMYFVCKRNLRAESVYDWLDHAKKYTLKENIDSPREGKTVYIGSTWLDREYKDASGETKQVTLRAVYEIIERTMDPDGQYLMPASVEVNMFLTNSAYARRFLIREVLPQTLVA